MADADSLSLFQKYPMFDANSYAQQALARTTSERNVAHGRMKMGNANRRRIKWRSEAVPMHQDGSRFVGIRFWRVEDEFSYMHTCRKKVMTILETQAEK